MDQVMGMIRPTGDDMDLQELAIRFVDFVLIGLNVAAWIVTDLQTRVPIPPKSDTLPKVNQWSRN